MNDEGVRERWYQGVTRYQWLVLVIASLGWVFDIFEGQIFVASRNLVMRSLLPEGATDGNVAFYANIAYGSFLLGGALGGIGFGILSDRIGRQRTMIYTILMYSACTCLSALSREWWEMAAFRFLVGMGVGGEWAVASAMVAEVFSQRARAWSLAIFHASSVLGTYLAILARVVVIDDPSLGWRSGFVIGMAPALLTLWVRWGLHEPESWLKARADAQTDLSKQVGVFRDLFRGRWLRSTLVGTSLATVGLATFWGTHIYGKDVFAKTVRTGQVEAGAFLLKNAEMIGMFLVTTGGGLGLVSFGAVAERFGRRGAFFFYHLGGFVAALVVFQVSLSVTVLLVALPVFGFLTLGMHAGYAVYFPELFPTRLRGSGAGFCFNAGRILAAPILILTGLMQGRWDMSQENAAALLCPLYLVGVMVLAAAPETRGRELPE